MKVLSLFAGVGGFDLGFQQAGMQTVAFCEIDPFAQKVLRKHWPGVPIIDDVRTITKESLKEVLTDGESIDVVCGGFPCQDISVAGRREGLAGARSGLWWEFHRIVAELHPRWVVIENVFGLLSSNGGRDMGAILGALGDLGYGYAYTVLDSQWFGVAQRRRRVFIVAKLGDGTGPAQVLFEPDRSIRDTPPSREARQTVATLLGSGAGTNRPAGVASEPDFLVTTPILEVGARTNGDGKRDRDGIGDPGDPMFTLQASKQHGIGFEIGPQGGALTDVAPTLDTRARNGPVQNQVGAGVIVGWPADVASTLNAHFGEKQGLEDQHINQGAPLFVPAVAIGFQGEDVSHTIRANPSKADKPDSSTYVVAAGVRRLTPRECERLQGFPDDFTKLNDKTPDSPRYRTMGNAVTVSVARWIGERIMLVDQ